MALSPGTRIGPYEVGAMIGEGGMGQVYRATDTNLKRQVAIKVLPDAVAADSERLARFQREAEVLASLNHPNIAAIHGLERAGGQTALVMELVEGPTLADRIAQGPIPVDEALQLAKQIAEALEAAHEQGIIHRDLKPANIKARPDGTVKVLDFGLAKVTERVGSSVDLSESPTITSPAMTAAGVILGTAAYLSPEQAKGRPADRRSDLWAFGCVLFEMLTGARAFMGDDISDTLAAVLRGEPTWTALPADTPLPIHRLLRRCLQRDRTRRLDSAAAARLEIQEVVNPPSDVAGASAAPPRPLSRRWIIAAATVALVVVAAMAVLARWLTTQPAAPPTPELVRFTVTPPAGRVLSVGSGEVDAVMSPDGRYLVYATGTSNASAQLMVRRMDQLEGVAVGGVSGARGPFISPDSRWIGFFVRPSSGSRAELRTVAMTGGPPVTVCPIEGQLRGASWGADNTIIFATTDPATGLMSVPARGGEPTVLTTPERPENEDHVFPSLLPDGRAVLFTILTIGASRAATAANAQVAVFDLKTGVTRVLLRGASQAEYVESGHVVYAAGNLLRAVRFDLDRLEVVGDPVTVVEGVQFKSVGVANFSLSRSGTLVHVPGGPSGSGQQTLAWVDRKGKEEPIPVSPKGYVYPRLSPDGTRIALDARDEEIDIWIFELARQTLQRLTNDPGPNRMPVWTPDSTRVAFTALRGGVESVHWQRVDGSGTMERLSTGTDAEGPNAFSPDGAQLIIQRPLSGLAYDLGVIALGENRPATMLLHSAANETSGNISPDGQWLAYESDEGGGDMQVWVRPFPNVGTQRHQVSTAGGRFPLWSRTGRELFYYVAPDTIMAVPVRLGGTIVLEKPQPAIKGLSLPPFNGRHYDVSADGQRFLILKDAAPPKEQTSVGPEIHVALNWTEELKRRVPVN